MPAPAGITPPQMLKTLVISSKADIETNFPKMGIWASSRIGSGQVEDFDVVSVGQTEITSLFAKEGNIPILKLKEKWNEEFYGPYVFVGPFATADGALNFSKANPQYAINAAVAKQVSQSMPAPAGITPPQMPKKLVILSKADIETNFPKMGIWALSRIGGQVVTDFDVVSVGQTEITSLFAKEGNIPILKLKEKWNEEFSGPYVFVGPFATADGALNFSKANPLYAIRAIPNSFGKKAPQPQPMPAPKSAPIPDEKSVKEKTAGELKKQVDEAIKSQSAGLMKEQSEIYKKFDYIIDENKKKNRLNVVKRYEGLKAAFIHSSAALNQNILALEYVTTIHAAMSPEQPLPSIGGKSIADMLMSCIECNAEIQKAFGKIYLGM